MEVAGKDTTARALLWVGYFTGEETATDAFLGFLPLIFMFLESGFAVKKKNPVRDGWRLCAHDDSVSDVYGVRCWCSH